MKLSRYSLILLLLGSLVLSACTQSTDKPATAAPDVKQTYVAKASPQQHFVEYSELLVRQPTEAGKKIEVLEFFAYFCPYCKSFDPVLSAWAKRNADRVVVKRVPVLFRDNMIAQQRMYYALESMGKLEELHAKLFEAVQLQRLPLDSDQAIFDYIGKQNIDMKEFKRMYDSFSVATQARMATEAQRAYGINSVPYVAIDGRFVTSAAHVSKRPGVQQSESGLQNATLQIMDELIAKVQNERRNRTGQSK